jgi:hypothetical protein
MRGIGLVRTRGGRGGRGGTGRQEASTAGPSRLTNEESQSQGPDADMNGDLRERGLIRGRGGRGGRRGITRLGEASTAGSANLTLEESQPEGEQDMVGEQSEEDLPNLPYIIPNSGLQCYFYVSTFYTYS